MADHNDKIVGSSGHTPAQAAGETTRTLATRRNQRPDPLDRRISSISHAKNTDELSLRDSFLMNGHHSQGISNEGRRPHPLSQQITTQELNDEDSVVEKTADPRHRDVTPGSAWSPDSDEATTPGLLDSIPEESPQSENDIEFKLDPPGTPKRTVDWNDLLAEDHAEEAARDEEANRQAAMESAARPSVEDAPVEEVIAGETAVSQRLTPQAEAAVTPEQKMADLKVVEKTLIHEMNCFAKILKRQKHDIKAGEDREAGLKRKVLSERSISEAATKKSDQMLEKLEEAEREKKEHLDTEAMLIEDCQTLEKKVQALNMEARKWESRATALEEREAAEERSLSLKSEVLVGAAKAKIAALMSLRQRTLPRWRGPWKGIQTVAVAI